MTQHCTPDRCYIVAWAFLVRPEHQSEFERAYGPNGEWVRLFRTGDGYLKTELHRDPEKPDRYITLDFWLSREQYEAFREQAKPMYQEIDARCERLTIGEQLLGDFADLTSLHTEFPRLGAETKIESAYTIRSATRDDVPEIVRLEQAAPSAAHWTPAAYEAIGRDDGAVRIVLLAEDTNRKPCGFVVGRTVVDECELENIVVSASELRQGIGSALIRELARVAGTRGIQRIFLEVRESNVPARHLYEAFGFTRDGERAAYYSDPVEKAILYSLTL